MTPFTTETLGIVAVLILAIGAERLGVLDLAGSLLAGFFGVVILIATDIGWFILLVVFTATSFLATRIGYDKKRQRHMHEPRGGRRGWKNVLANGLTATVVAAAGFWVAPERLALPFAVAVAAAAADTFASELGGLADEAVLITDPTRRVPPGTNGGVSVPGFAASALGAGLVAGVAHLLIPLDWDHVTLVVLLGLSGSIIDSFLGATWEGDPGRRQGPLTKNDVNFIAITIPAFVVLFLSLMGWT
ncbi:MAG: DUF92 domain-containing protein [Euryarchaeota archaeon]|nr:DUF92 domain-containing protein [Euryarchaeota archaeon]